MVIALFNTSSTCICRRTPSEIKLSVFEKNSDDAFKHETQGGESQSQRRVSAQVQAKEAKMDAAQRLVAVLSLSDILSANTVRLLSRVLYGIAPYLNYGAHTFADEFCVILPFVLRQFVCVVANVISKMLTQQIAESAQESGVYQRMLVEQLLAEVLKASAQRSLKDGQVGALAERRMSL